MDVTLTQLIIIGSTSLVSPTSKAHQVAHHQTGAGGDLRASMAGLEARACMEARPMQPENWLVALAVPSYILMDSAGQPCDGFGRGYIKVDLLVRGRTSSTFPTSPVSSSRLRLHRFELRQGIPARTATLPVPPPAVSKPCVLRTLRGRVLPVLVCYYLHLFRRELCIP